MLKNVNLKKLDRLKAELPTSLVKNNTASDSNHIYFAETKDEKQTMLESRMIQSAIPIDLEKESTSSTPSRALLEYQIRQERLEKLALAETKLQNQKHIMQPGRRKITKVDEYGHPVFKWKAERKK